ncbi:hypothetical protein DFS34DRAFT_689910 [Phlyctochytrium arcticum]|nr:hypothetical protein DFS34DRAFT_689910 [Phlyctochytrium arcticum]
MLKPPSSAYYKPIPPVPLTLATDHPQQQHPYSNNPLLNSAHISNGQLSHPTLLQGQPPTLSIAGLANRVRSSPNLQLVNSRHHLYGGGDGVSSPGSSARSIAVFSGGSAMNSFVTLLQGFTDDTSYIMPVSDDGGSTSEIIKALGGPGIGDLRSRVVRLAETGTSEAKAVHDLLSYRLPFDNAECPPSAHPHHPYGQPLTAKTVWFDILEGKHPLWQGISAPYRETIRAFLAHFQHEIIRSACRRPPFEYQGGSIGNFFLTGSRLFFDNLDAAVFQFARIMRVPGRTDVVPVLATARGVVTIAAALRNGETIYGQCEISHPGQVVPAGSRKRTGSLASPAGSASRGPSTPGTPIDLSRNPFESSVPRVPFQSLKNQPANANLVFSKDTCVPLASPIRRIYYVNREHQEIFPDLNPLVQTQLARKRTIIYGCGSLYTSILPCLIVPGAGRLLADPIPARRSYTQGRAATFYPGSAGSAGFASLPSSPRLNQSHHPYHPHHHNFHPGGRVKVLLLNGSLDRETKGYTALDFILSITDALNYSCVAEEQSVAAATAKTAATGGHSSSGSSVMRKGSILTRKAHVIDDPDGAVQVCERDEEGRPTGLSWWTGLDTQMSSPQLPRRSAPVRSQKPGGTAPIPIRQVIDKTLDELSPPSSSSHLLAPIGSGQIGGTSPLDLPSATFGAQQQSPSEYSTSDNSDNSDSDMDGTPEPTKMTSESGLTYLCSPHPPAAYITHMLFPEDTAIAVDVPKIEALGIRCVRVKSAAPTETFEDFSTGIPADTPNAGASNLADSKKGYYGTEELREVLEHLVM